jgi:hypothetical protein
MQSSQSSLEVGVELLNAGKLDQAYERLVHALEELPGDPRVLVQLGKLALRAKMPDEARNFLLEAGACSGAAIPLIQSLANELIQMGHFNEAVVVQTALKEVADNPPATPIKDAPPPQFPYQLTFCVGAPRSGTTVVGSLLSEGPSAFPMLPECTFVTQLIRQFHDIMKYADKPRFDAYAKTPTDLVNIFRPAIEGFIKAAHSHFTGIDARHLILKDPDLSPYVDCLQFFFTDFKLVCVIRDPRDVVASLIKVYAKKGSQQTLEEVIAQTFTYYRQISDSEIARAGRVHFIRFEKIMHKNEAEFSRLENFLGYAVGRQGFGKIFFEFDRNDATFSDNYGASLSPPIEDRSPLGQDGTSKVEKAFTNYNAIYHWW